MNLSQPGILACDMNATFMLLKIQRFEALNSFTVLNFVRIEFDGKNSTIPKQEKRYDCHYAKSGREGRGVLGYLRHW